ncbi:MAG: TetR/AcrR family transcriptional regulator [Candidatus Saccharibacteria bacterium]|nr:TetR/AcrR family transcriptional regulator [Pseudorhodobacter sp.]
MQLAVPHTADQRSAEILGLVRQAFVEKGFDGASMQDLARAAGMSVGNFYRYFPSKAAIIQALIDADHADLRRDFAIIRQSPHPMAALRQMVRSELASECMGHDTTLWTEIEAASQRNPDIGAAVQRMEAEVASCLIGIFAVECGVPEDEAKARFSAQAAFIMVLFKAASCLKSPVSSHDGELKSLIIRTIDQTLDDVAPSSLKA